MKNTSKDRLPDRSNGRPAEPGPRLTVAQRLLVAILPPLAALLLRVLDRTLRYEVVTESGAEPAAPPALQVWCFWHRCLLPSACYFRKTIKPAVLISRSFDGELIARTIERLGYRTVRGSSSRYGASGVLALASAVEAGYPAVLTADGPRGPVYKVKPGAVKLAQLTGYPVGAFYALPERAWLLRSWDRFMIPKPFSRVAVSWARQVQVPAIGDAEIFEAKRLEVEVALERARLNAERHFGTGRPGTRGPTRLLSDHRLQPSMGSQDKRPNAPEDHQE